MISINQPQDILGLGIKNILSFRLDDLSYQNLVMSVNKVIVIEFRNIYAVTVFFKGEKITIEYDEHENYDLRISLDINTMVAIARGDIGPITGFLKGNLKVKKIWNIGLLLKFIKIFIPNLKLAGERALIVKNQ